MLSEFDLIKRYFTRPPRAGGPTVLGVGDDCALFAPAAGMQLAISSDMLVEGRHFLPGADPAKLAHKCLAVNLSDLAAMGAQPQAFTLAFSLPEADAGWLEAFAAGLFALADEYGCELIGGDTTKGPRTICITVFGQLPPGQALRRDAAKAGDELWISGSLGDARLALAGYWNELQLSEEDFLLAQQRMHTPTPRVTLGMALRGIAHAAIDVSDGLAGDLGHILARSSVGATLALDALPPGPALAKQMREIRRNFTLAGGDDYELCFTAPPENHQAVLNAGAASNTAVTCIGRIEAQPGLRLTDAAGAPVDLRLASFDHFASH